MSPELYALLERLHGHLALLGLAVLLHPVITLGRRGRPTRGQRWSVGLAALLLTLPALGGAWLYPTYRAEVKPRLLRDELELARAFESKEHLAFAAVVLTLAGAAALFAAGEEAEGRRLARLLLGLGWCCGLLVGLLGIFVASGAHPAW